MRPTDENQSPSLRPNLMSPRRSSGEDSILAMLERDPARKRGKGAGGRLAWYGASAAMAVVLTGTLVWLAAANDGRQVDGSALTLDHAILASPGSSPVAPSRGAPVSTPAVPSDPPSAVRQVAMATTMATAPPAARPTSAAVIVDQDPGDKVPPLRLLKPAPARQAAPPAVRVPAPRATATAPARTAPRNAAAAARAAPQHAGEARQAARPRVLAAARNNARPGQGKAQRNPAPGKGAETQVDADVALISAVIVHANGHAPTGSQMTELLCPNDNCKEKPARE